MTAAELLASWHAYTQEFPDYVLGKRYAAIHSALFDAEW